MRYYIIAGEASGDLHGGNLVKELLALDPHAKMRGFGGDNMQAHGVEIVKHIRDLAFMGIVEVLKNIRIIKRNMDLCKEDLLAFHPDALILVDYPGFNLRIARFAHQHNIRVFYYISPTVWAWHKSRIKQIKEYVEKLFVIFPFEKDFYKELNLEVDYCGNPLIDALENRPNKNEVRSIFLQRNQLPNLPIIALLAGSRKQEINKILPIMLQVVRLFPDHQFVLAAAPGLSDNDYQNAVSNLPITIPILRNQTYELLQQSVAALVTSGTATLETALLNVPQVVCYKTGTGTWEIGKRLVNIKYISIVNLIMNKLVVKELLQYNLTVSKLQQELKLLIYDNQYRNNILNHYKELQIILGGSGASTRVAKKMFHYLTLSKI